MLAISRSLVTVKPTGNYIEWAMEVAPPAREDRDSFREEVESNGNAYLIEDPDTEDINEARALLARHWRAIANEEFEAWWTDEAEWPELKDFADFERFFMWSHVEMVLDTLDTKIEKEGEEL